MWRFLGMRAHGAKFGSRFFSQAAPKKKIGMKELVREYGWAATGVYLGLSFIDLPLSYMLVHNAGQDRLESWEVSVRKLVGANADSENTYVHKAATGGKSLFWAEFGIAYIIHKSLIFIRVPITVAITPRIASKLGQWGFNVKRAVPTVDKGKMGEQIADVKKAAEKQMKK